jgi:hypothetical protein
MSAVCALPAAARAPANRESYCDAALRALHYRGTSAPHLRALLDAVVELAPPQLRADARRVRSTPAGSPRYVTARTRWLDRTTGLCCGCTSQYTPPVVAATVPT